MTQDDHVSMSAYVTFAVDAAGNKGAVGQQLQRLGASAVIWTTTPWTIPANVAISVHPQLSYSVVKVGAL